MTSPYESRPARSFWKSGVSEQRPPAIPDLYRKRFALDPEMKIATAGSCFAQHIARRLRDVGYAVIDKEPAPRLIPPTIAKEYGYGLYSARYGNVYTVRQLLQLAREATGSFAPADAVWRKDGRFFDALRPSVEPAGLATEAEVRAHRASHLKHVAAMLRELDLLVFTFGLTETWEHKASGTVYPTAPGTIAGDFDPETFGFRNLTHAETLADFIAFREIVHGLNPKAKFLVTVSPVPLTATATEQHVLPATVYSKSVLRAVAGELYDRFEDVDYFPSYEIVAAHPSKGALYEANLRSVAESGVDAVMTAFLAAHGAQAVVEDPTERQAARRAARKARKIAKRGDAKRSDVVCEEQLLEAFAQ